MIAKVNFEIDDNSILKQVVTILGTFSGIKNLKIQDDSDDIAMTSREILADFENGVKTIKAIQEGIYDTSKLQTLDELIVECEKK